LALGEKRGEIKGEERNEKKLGKEDLPKGERGKRKRKINK